MKPTSAQIQEWESRLDIGWPTDPDDLREWQLEGHEPEHTLETLAVIAPPAEFLARLDHYAARSKRAIPELASVLAAWHRNTPAPALAICIIADALERHDNGAALWLYDALWDLLEWATWPKQDQRRQLRAFERTLREQNRERSKALTQLDKACNAFLQILRDDWRAFEPEDYLDTLGEWQRDWTSL